MPSQHNLNIVVGLDMKMTVHTTPHHPTPPEHTQKLNGRLQEYQINIHWSQLNKMW